MNIEALEALEAEWQAQGGLSAPKTPQGEQARLPVASIEILPDLYQARGRHDLESGIVDEYHRDALIAVLKSRKNADLDPVTILKIGQRHILVDGHHRLIAYKTQKREQIPVRYFLGSPTDAVLEAGEENGKTRLQMTKHQCSERAWALVVADRGWSVSKIAKGTGVSERRVFQMRAKRKELLAAGEELPESWMMVLRGAFQADPDAVPKMVAKYVESIERAVGMPSNFNTTGKIAMLGDALIEWSGPLAIRLAAHLFHELDLDELYEVLKDRRAEEDAELEGLDF